MRAFFLSNVNTDYGYCARRLIIGRAKFGNINSRNSSTVLAAQSSIATPFSEGHIPSEKKCIFFSGLKKTHTTNNSYGCPVTSHCLIPTPRNVLSAMVMAASSSQSVSGGVLLDNRISSCRRALPGGEPAGVSYRGICSRQKASMSLQYCLACGFLMTCLALNAHVPCALLGSSLRSSAPFSSRCYSNGAAPDLPFNVPLTDEQLGVPADLPAQESTSQATLKLISGSCYLPHPDKEKTGGEDAHFICEDEQVIGVADGVGGWADVGIDAGEYARQLMSNAISSIKNDSKASIDPLKVLEKAYAATKAQGSSTACIIALTDQGIHAINLGDSGFVVIRDGSTVFQSPPQQYGFNFPYQLGSDPGADLPSSGQVFTFPVKAGDVIVAGTDGLFDNLYNNEISAIVVHARRVHLDPLVTARKIAALAQERARDLSRQTPFSASAQEAGFRYYGGKLDDITVIVSYVTDRL